jgi:DNA-binding SARP family transcriptional activator
VQFRVLGPVEIHADDGRVLSLGRRHERLLLGILLLESGRTVSADRICDLLWSHGDAPSGARRSVQTYVARIRAVLNDGGARGAGVALSSRPGGYTMTVPRDAVDAHRFRNLLDEAQATADPREREGLLNTALALWRGPALDERADDGLRQRLCGDLDELRLQAVEALAETRMELGRNDDLIAELARLVAEHSVRERLVELYMLALHRAGRRVDALDVYERTRSRLADELGLDPGHNLRRTHEAILRDDAGLAARPAGPTRRAGMGVVPAQLPADLSRFAGRTDHLHRLDLLVPDADRGAAASAVVISAIAGTAGVGKTALAVHWAHGVRHRFPDGQLYVNLRGFDPAAAPIPPAQVVRSFLDALQIPARRIPAGFDAQVGLYRGLLAGKKVLVVLDNARDCDQVRPLLPEAPGCLVLVTSRDRLTGLVVVDGAHPLTLDLLSLDEGRQLLATRLGGDRLAAEPAAADELIELCARLPLALAIAAARAAIEPELPLAAVAAQLRSARGALDAFIGDDSATDIRAVFACSYDTLSPAAARLFRLLSVHPRSEISVPAAASVAGVPPGQVAQLLAELTKAHLLNEPAPGRYTVHDLLHAYAVEQSGARDSGDERRAALHRLLDHDLHTAHAADRLLQPHRQSVTLTAPQPGVTLEDIGDATRAMDWLTTECPMLVTAVHRAAESGFDTHAVRLAAALVVFLDRQGRWGDWCATQQAALQSARRLGDLPAQAVAHGHLGRAYLRQGRQDEAQAEAHFRGALELYRALGDQTGQAHAHLDLAEMFYWRSRYRGSLEHAMQALDLYRATGHRVGQAAALNGIGYYHALLGEHEQALTYCQPALTLNQELGNRRGEAATWDSLGYAHHHLGDHGEAVTCYCRAIELYRLTGDRYNEADTLTHLADTRHATGDTRAARETWDRALRILDDLDHPDADRVRARLRALTRAGGCAATPNPAP